MIEKIVRALAAVALAAALSFPAFGEDSLVGFYDSELVKVGYMPFGGLTLVARGQSTSTSMGISPAFKDILSEFRDSREAYDNYARKNSLGNILLYGGLACALGGIYYPLLSVDANTGYTDYDATYRTSMYLCLGGLAAEVVGAFMLPSSLEELLTSVNLYNRERLAQFK